MSELKLAAMYMYQGDYDSASFHFQQVVSDEDLGTRAGARYGLANLYAYRGQLKEAAGRFQQVIAANELFGIGEQSQDVGLGLVSLYLEMGDTVGALSKAREAVLRADLSTHWKAGWATASMIECLGHLNRMDQARQELNRLEAFGRAHYDSEVGYTLAARGHLALQSGHTDSAAKHFERLNVLDHDFFSRYMLGRTYLQAGRLADAVDTLEAAAGSYSDERLYAAVWQVDVHYYLGRAYEASGWHDRAVEQYEKFLGIWRDADPGLAKVADARARLERLSVAF